MMSKLARRGLLPAVGTLLAVFQLSVASAHAQAAQSPTTQTPPSQEKTTLSPAAVRAATSALDAHVKSHPKEKDGAVAAKKASARTVGDERTTVLRTPVPAVKAKPKAKKTP